MQNKMKFLTGIALLLLLGVVGVQVYRLYSQRVALRAELQKLHIEVAGANKENQKLQSDIAYFAKPENVFKELKGMFNYKRPGEKLYIVVP